MTAEQEKALINYLKATKAFDTSLKYAKRGYGADLSMAVQKSVAELKKLFSQEEVDYLTCAAYQPEIMAHYHI